MDLDLNLVQHTYQQAQQFPILLTEPQRSTLPTQVQHALSLVRGPFLDGFWLHKDAPFDEWHEQRQWQVRLLFLLERLSLWQEDAGEMHAAIETLQRWLVLEPLSEEATRRLMRVHLAQGEVSTALQVYAACRTRLADELQVQPSTETTDLAERIRTTQASHAPSRGLPARLTTVESQLSHEPYVPLVGREAVFTQLSRSYSWVQQSQPQGVLVVGEAGIGKTRLTNEFATWAKAQGAEVLRGHALEMGRLPFQLIVDAIRPRIEQENAPEDVLDDLWLSELSSLLPELRVRYPDLPAPEKDELTAKARLFEAVARLVDVLAQRSPLVMLLDDLHCADEVSFEVLHYLARSWSSRSSRVLLVGTVRSDEVEQNAHLAAHLTDLGRQLPVTQVALHSLNQSETLQVVGAFLGVRRQHSESNGEVHGADVAQRAIIGSGTAPVLERATLVVRLGEVLFAHTKGHPLYLLETLKLLRDRQWLLPRVEVDGTWTLEQTPEMGEVLSGSLAQGEWLPTSVQALIQGRLAKLAPVTQQVVQAGAVLGNTANAQWLWQMAEVGGEQTGMTALEEAVGAGIMCLEEDRGGHRVRYRFTHELIREVVYTKLSAVRRQVLHRRALLLYQHERVPAAERAYHALRAGEMKVAYRYRVQAGTEAVVLLAIKDAIGHYEQARALLQHHPWLLTDLAASEVEQLYAHLGRAFASLNTWEEAQSAYTELLAYARQYSLLSLISMTLNRMAILAVQRSFDKRQVQALLEEARQMAQSSHDQKALAETEWSQAHITVSMWQNPTNALPHGVRALSLAQALHDRELEAQSLSSLGYIHLVIGDFEEAIQCTEASLAHYARLASEQSARREMFLSPLLIDVPLTQSLTQLALEAYCWTFQATAQVHIGQVQDSIRSGRRALALAQESKNDWVQVASTVCLAYGLLDAGAYEEVLTLMQPILVRARVFAPSEALLLLILAALSRTYYVLQQWEEERAILEEAVMVAERGGSGGFLVVSFLSQLCMHYALAGEWRQAHVYAIQAIAARKHVGRALTVQDFSPHYEIEALLHVGDERLAREEVQRLGDRVGSNRRFRLPYLRSLTVLAVWEGHNKQALDALIEAAELAAEIGLPEEQWQIQAALGRVCEGRGEREHAHTAFAEAERIIQELAVGIGDEGLRTRFIAARQIQRVMQHASNEASQISNERCSA